LVAPAAVSPRAGAFLPAAGSQKAAVCPLGVELLRAVVFHPAAVLPMAAASPSRVGASLKVAVSPWLEAA
jgi:hypothetical protein